MQHHTPASVAATAVGVSVALQIPRFILVAELAFRPGLLTPPVFIPFSVLFIPCALRNQHSLMISERRSSRQILPVGRSVLLPLLQDLPFLYPRSVHNVQTNGFSSMYSTWFHMNKTLTDWTLSSCTLPLPSARAHQPHAQATDRVGAWDSTAAGTKFALQLTSTNELLFYSFPIARRQSPQGGRGRSPSIRAPAWTRVLPGGPSVVTEGYIRWPPLPPTSR